jgi:hypothetical protein
VLLVWCPGSVLAATAPPWLHALVGVSLPEHDEEAGAVLLYSETVVAVQPNGRLRRLTREAYRILRREGEPRGLVQIDFKLPTRITALRAWSISAEGKDYEVGMKNAVETALPGIANGELVSDVRAEMLQIPSAVPGSIIGYEAEQDEQPYVMEDEWEFQDTVAVREARYTLQLPAGWQYKATWLNFGGTAATQSGGVSQWIVRDVPAVPIESNMPPWRGVAGRLVIAFQPPAGPVQGFQDWHAMGTWYFKLAQGRRDSSPKIKQKVAELTAAAPNLRAKIQALARFVQEDIRYVAIELGIGGQQPHAATDVLNHGYGDCKDKVTLLSAMLGEIGVDSHYVILYSRRGAVTETTPANLGFDHAIIAIQLPQSLEDADLLASESHPKLGRILFFDPTDALTPLGLLAGPLQAGYGLLVTPDGGELLKLPQLPAAVNSVQRTAKLTLDESGTLRGDVHEIWSGDMAAEQRDALRSTTQETDRIRAVESIMGDSLATFSILKATITNPRANDKPLEWSYAVEAEHYSRAMGDLLVVRPRVLGSQSSGFLETRKPRRQPIEFDCLQRSSDLFEIALPEGYEPEDLPPPVNLEYEFASYQSKTELVGHTLRYTRTVEIKSLSLPVSRSEELRQFYRRIYADERMQATLRRARS